MHVRYTAAVNGRPSCPRAPGVIPQCPSERPGTPSAARSHTGLPAPSPSPSNAGRSAAPPSACLRGPRGPHTWCGDDSAPYGPRSVCPEGPVRNTK